MADRNGHMSALGFLQRGPCIVSGRQPHQREAKNLLVTDHQLAEIITAATKGKYRNKFRLQTQVTDSCTLPEGEHRLVNAISIENVCICMHEFNMYRSSFEVKLIRHQRHK